MPRHEDRYMERSEKRSSYNRVPRKIKRNPGHGFWYGLGSIIVAIILWPLGMVMLWTRSLRWNAGVKLIASMLTLILCLCWIGFSLTVQTDDPRITYLQDRINDVLSTSADYVADRAAEIRDDVVYTAGQLGDFAADKLPEAAKWTNDTLNDGKNALLGLVGIEPEVTPTPEPTSEPTEEPTVEPTVEPTDEPTAEPSEEPDTEASEEPSAEPTEEPSAEPTEEPAEEPSAEPVEVADGTPAPGRSTAQPQQLDIDADPTPAPTVKPAGEAVVYHSSNGKSYHEAPDCVGLRGAGEHTLADSVADGFKACGNCNPPAKALLTTTETVMWQDELNVVHTSDECYNFSGKYELVKQSKLDSEALACPMCGATSYMPDMTVSLIYVTPEPTEGAETEAPTEEPTEAPTEEPTEEPTAEPTEEPTEEPTPEPTPEPTAEPTEEPTPEPTAEPTPEPTPEPSVEPTLKPAGEAIVYHTNNGVGYHRASRCIGMSSAKEYTLAESVADGFHACGNCDVPDPSILDSDEPVLWVDKADIYHMSDECALFEGKWTLMTLTEAGEAGCQPCMECGAEKYVYVAPTPEPTVEPTPVPDNSELPHKSAGELIVYHTSNGRSYHAAEKCRTMSGAKPYTLAESIADGFGACGLCDVPHEDIVNYPVIWLDETEVGHISDLCTYFEGKCELVSIYDAVKNDIAGCPYCGAGDYIAGETERLMELAKNAVVYYNNESKYYHKAAKCLKMYSASEHSLYDALERGLLYCKDCEPYKLSDMDAETETEADEPAE